MPFDQRLKVLNLPTLKYRRHRGDMIECLKIVSDFLCKEIGTITRGHNLKLHKRTARSTRRIYSFSYRVVTAWKNLPQNIVTAPNVGTFECRLDGHCEYDMKFNYKAASGQAVRDLHEAMASSYDNDLGIETE